MSYDELVANARREAQDVEEKREELQLYVARQTGYDGLKLVSDAVRSGLMAIANSARELLDDQYRSVALALLETTLLDRWDRLAMGSKVNTEEPLCNYYCQKGNPRCIDPHSKFLCPVYLITGSPNCANRPFYTKVKEIDLNKNGKWSLDIEYQTEFLTKIIFALFPQKKHYKPYSIFDVGDTVKPIPFDELKKYSGVRSSHDGNILFHLDYPAPNKGIYYDYNLHRVYKYEDEFYKSEYEIIDISSVYLRVKNVKDKTICLLPIWSCYRTGFKGFGANKPCCIK